jgi:hypothetical protein
VKFVWMDVVGAGRVAVNPDQVRYIKRRRDSGRAALVFSALAGGYDELELDMTPEAAAAALEGGHG